MSDDRVLPLLNAVEALAQALEGAADEIEETIRGEHGGTSKVEDYVNLSGCAKYREIAKTARRLLP